MNLIDEIDWGNVAILLLIGPLVIPLPWMVLQAWSDGVHSTPTEKWYKVHGIVLSAIALTGLFFVLRDPTNIAAFRLPEDIDVHYEFAAKCRFFAIIFGICLWMCAHESYVWFPRSALVACVAFAWAHVDGFADLSIGIVLAPFLGPVAVMFFGLIGAWSVYTAVQKK